MGIAVLIVIYFIYKYIMKNIIGNSCSGSYLTKNFEEHNFINPFCWNIIDFNSMYNLIKNYDTINWKNYALKKENDNSFSIIIDGIVNVNYVHYNYTANVDKKIVETDEDTDFISKNIEPYLIEKYETRVKRMNELNIPPIFILASRNLVCKNNYTPEQIKQILELNTPYIIIAATEFKIDYTISQNYKFKNREIINLPQNKIRNNGLPLAEYIATHSTILHY